MLKTINRPDDTIKLAGCEIGSSSRVTFDLVGFDFGPFTARLQQSERGEFTVTPDRGETLDAINGTTFTIDYAPVEYGRQCRARLIINTPQRAVSRVITRARRPCLIHWRMVSYITNFIIISFI